MNDNLHASTQRLIANIEKKDRRFRVAQAIFMALVALAMIVLLLLNYVQLIQKNHLLGQQGALLQQQKDSTEELKRNTNDRLDKVDNHIDCIAKFFAQSNRAELSIADLQSCSITTTSTLTPGYTPVDKSDPEYPGDPYSSPTTTNSTNQQQNQQTQTTAQTPEPTHNPYQVFGVPVCTPLVKLCLSN